MGQCLLGKLLQLTLIVCLIKKFEQSCLETKNSTKCCADFYFQDGDCIPCRPGWIGPNCIAKCPFPTYGHRCINDCHCARDECDVSEGCIKKETTLKSYDDAIFGNETSKGIVGDANSPTNKENIQRNDKTEELNRPKSKSTPTSVIVTSVVAAFIIAALIVVIVFHVKSKIQTRIHTIDSKRGSKVTSQWHVDSYCDIDEDKMEDIECNIDNELEIYESIDQSKKDATKCTEIQTRQGISTQARNLLSNNSMQKILDDPDDDEVNDKHVDGSESKVQTRKDNLKVLHDVQPKRMGKTSTEISGYIDMRKNTPEDYVSMNAEQLEANSQTRVNSMNNVS